MYDQSCDFSPIDHRNLPKLDPTCIFQQGFRETYHPYNSPSCFYSKNSPLGECSSNFSTQASSYPSNFSFGTAAMNALNNMHTQGFNPSAFGKKKPSSFSPTEHQMIRSEKTSLEDTQNLLDGHNSCEEEDLEGGRSQIKVHSSSTILNYPPNADYSNKQMQFLKHGSSNTQKSYNPSLVPVKLPEAMQYQQANIPNIPQKCFLDQSGEFQNRHQFLEKNALGQHGAYSGISQPCEALDQDQCSQGLTGENPFPLNFQYPSNYLSVGDYNHNTYQNHYPYQHHRPPHPYQNYHQFQQQISSHQMLHPDQAQITQGSISQSQQLNMFNQPQLSNSLHSTTQIDSPSNCTQQFHQYPGNEEFQTFHPQKQQHLQQNHIQAQLHQQHQLHQQQQQFQYSRLEEQQKSAQNNITLLQYQRQFQRIELQDTIYQQNQSKPTDQSHLEFQHQQNQIHPLLQGNHLTNMPITKVESIEQNSPNKSIEDCKSQKSDDIQEEEDSCSSQDSNHSSQSSSSILSSRNNEIHEKQAKQVKQPNAIPPKKSKKNPELIKGPNSKRINRSTSLSSQNNIFGNSKISKKQTNETKNIPKNYSKAIIGYIQKHPEDCARLLGTELTFSEFESFLMEKKEKLTAIKDLRSLWTSKAADKKQETFNRVFRILSFKFFREDAVAYIYSSHKIKNTRALITYRFILQRALHDPESFQFMKFQN